MEGESIEENTAPARTGQRGRGRERSERVASMRPVKLTAVEVGVCSRAERQAMQGEAEGWLRSGKWAGMHLCWRAEMYREWRRNEQGRKETGRRGAVQSAAAKCKVGTEKKTGGEGKKGGGRVQDWVT